MKLKKRKLILFLGAALILGYLFQQENAHSPGQILTQSADKKSLSFALIGDWGVKGRYYQKEVAKQLNYFCDSRKLDFVITGGDNFYSIGVESTEDEHWQKSYEEIYQGASMDVPWYPVLGNHDYGGKIEAQFDYTEKSKNWTFPAKYYAVECHMPQGLEVLLVFLDTNPFHDPYYKDPKYKGIQATDSTAQKEWLAKVLKKSDADWKLVVGHHPLYTGGLRSGDKPYVRMHLEKVMEEYGVDAYLCGHEHDLQHLTPPGKTEYFVSGAAAMVRPTGKIKSTRFSASEPGFILFELNQEQMEVEMIEKEGFTIYRSSIEKKEPSLLQNLYDLIAG